MVSCWSKVVIRQNLLICRLCPAPFSQQCSRCRIEKHIFSWKLILHFPVINLLFRPEQIQPVVEKCFKNSNTVWDICAVRGNFASVEELMCSYQLDKRAAFHKFKSSHLILDFSGYEIVSSTVVLYGKAWTGRDVRVVQDMYHSCKTIVRCAVGVTEAFKVEFGMHQGLTLSPCLIALVINRLQNSHKKLQYMCVNGSGTCRTLTLQGEDIKRVQDFRYLGLMIQTMQKKSEEAYASRLGQVIKDIMCDKKYQQD